MKVLTSLFFLLFFSPVVDAQLVTVSEDSGEEVTEDVTDSDSIDPMLLSSDTVIRNLEMLDLVVSDYNVFFTGENHRYSNINDDIKYNFITYLHEEVGLNYVAIEFGPTTGWLINRYIVENDTTIEDFFYKMPNKSYERLFKRLRKYNKTQPKGKKIHVLGVDAQKIKYQIYYAIDCYIRDKDISKAHDSIQLHLEALHYKAGMITDYRNTIWETEEEEKNTNDSYRYNYSENITTLRLFSENYWKHKSRYDRFFGKDAKLVEGFVRNFKEYLDYTLYSYRSEVYLDVFRERLMIQRMNDIIKKDKKAKIFAQFGKCHVAGIYSKEFCDRKNFVPFADRVKKEKGVEALVIGIAYSYKDEKECYDSTYVDWYKDAPADSLTLVANKSIDTALTEPDFLLIAPQYDYKETKDGDIEEEEVWSYDKNFNININYVTGFKLYDEANLNFNFSEFEFLYFEEYGLYQGFDFSLFENGKGYFGLQFANFEAQSYGVADSLTASYNSSKYGCRFGTELTRSSVFNIGVYTGFEYQTHKISIEENNFFDYLYDPSAFEPIEITNSAALIDLGLDINLRLYFFNVSLRGGYQFDVSGEEWKGTAANYESDFGGLYGEAAIGVSINTAD